MKFEVHNTETNKIIQVVETTPEKAAKANELAQSVHSPLRYIEQPIKPIKDNSGTEKPERVYNSQEPNQH